MNTVYQNLHKLCIMQADYQNAKNLGNRERSRELLTEITELLIDTNKQVMAESKEQFPEIP